jgi:hypothetical protein
MPPLTPEQIRGLITIGVAQKAFPRFLFKYRMDGPHTESIFTHNELRFSNPHLFNDPYDCNTPINIHTPLEDIRTWLRNVGVDAALVNRFAEELRHNPNFMKEATEHALSELGICCFSTNETSILQWSHYSDYHKGICIKFDITHSPEFFFNPVIVAYRQVMPHYNHFTMQEKLVDHLIRPKSAEWSYESEIRIVKTAQYMAQNGGNRNFRFHDNSMREVIFGAKTPEDIKEKYQRLCADNNKAHVQFFEMRLDDGPHYKLIKV